MEEKKQDRIPEIRDEALDAVAGGRSETVKLSPEFEDYFANLGVGPTAGKKNGTAGKTAGGNASGPDA